MALDARRRSSIHQKLVGDRRARQPGRAALIVLRDLDRSTAWDPVDEVEVDGDVGHPQGLTPWGDHWLMSTVLSSGRGELLVVDRAGAVVDRRDVTDAERFHPGGMSADDDGCWVAVAEYRPDSTTTVVRVDADLHPVDSFRFDDHLGAVCDLGDGTLLAVSWGSRTFYRLDVDGHVVESVPNRSRWVDHQDLTVTADGTVVATGVGSVGSVQLGGLAVIDPDELRPVFETPVQAWMPSGRVVTYNGCHVDPAGGEVRIHCIVDDRTASIATWAADG